MTPNKQNYKFYCNVLAAMKYNIQLYSKDEIDISELLTHINSLMISKYKYTIYIYIVFKFKS